MYKLFFEKNKEKIPVGTRIVRKKVEEKDLPDDDKKEKKNINLIVEVDNEEKWYWEDDAFKLIKIPVIRLVDR